MDVPLLCRLTQSVKAASISLQYYTATRTIDDKYCLVYDIRLFYLNIKNINIPKYFWGSR